MTIKVIGAGMGRTGTRSLKTALELLGFGKCYHMEELIAHPEHARYWEAAGAGRPVGWDALFAGYQSTTDFPGYRHYRELMRHYPDAKVILTVRDPEEWYASTYATIYQAAPDLRGKLKLALKLPFSRRLRQLIPVFRLPDRLVWKGDFAGRFADKAFALEKYREHSADVARTVPPERLLTYDVREGWGPLCRFLGVPEPSAPFPHHNPRAEFLGSRSLI
ncbi:MAG TPA: sulfotransferase [Roseiflexaceae bacterium]|nr:sulfotransferase [Roseiflexaceae bacterium]